jgi:hypothetical protein
MQHILGVTIQHNANTIYQQKSTSHKIRIKSKHSAIERREASALCRANCCSRCGMRGEVRLGYLSVLVVALGAPLGGATHLLDLALTENLDVVRVEMVKPRDLNVKLVLRCLRYRQHLLLDDLRSPHAAVASERAGRGRGSGGVGAWAGGWDGRGSCSMAA